MKSSASWAKKVDKIEKRIFMKKIKETWKRFASIVAPDERNKMQIKTRPSALIFPKS